MVWPEDGLATSVAAARKTRTIRVEVTVLERIFSYPLSAHYLPLNCLMSYGLAAPGFRDNIYRQ